MQFLVYFFISSTKSNNDTEIAANIEDNYKYSIA